MQHWTRRGVLRSGVALGATGIAWPSLGMGWHAGGTDRIGVGVIGCGGRGTGAAMNALEAHPSTRIVALADLFSDRLSSSLGYLIEAEDFAERVDVADRRFIGFDAYKRLLALDEVDLVILATPPGFRPMHVEAAVEAGKHVFMEKPAAVDPAGVRRVIAASTLASEKRLSIVAGTQRRHEACYLEALSRVESGQIGRVMSARCAWNQGGLWVHDRQPNESDMEWQCRNWLYFCWLSGDHICEQHVHNLDVINWAMGGPPISAYGMGGRQVRTDERFGNIYDHFAVEYDYGDGRYATSQCRQQDGTQGLVQETITGTAGTLTTRPGYASITGNAPWRFEGTNPNPYAREHVQLIASIRGDGPYRNEGQQVAESTLTAIMGRMSAYTGQRVTWQEAMDSSLDLSPDSYELGPLAVRPVPRPGRG